MSNPTSSASSRQRKRRNNENRGSQFCDDHSGEKITNERIIVSKRSMITRESIVNAISQQIGRDRSALRMDNDYDLNRKTSNSDSDSNNDTSPFTIEKNGKTAKIERDSSISTKKLELNCCKDNREIEEIQKNWIYETPKLIWMEYIFTQLCASPDLIIVSQCCQLWRTIITQQMQRTMKRMAFEPKLNRKFYEGSSKDMKIFNLWTQNVWNRWTLVTSIEFRQSSGHMMNNRILSNLLNSPSNRRSSLNELIISGCSMLTSTNSLFGNSSSTSEVFSNLTILELAHCSDLNTRSIIHHISSKLVRLDLTRNQSISTASRHWFSNLAKQTGSLTHIRMQYCNLDIISLITLIRRNASTLQHIDIGSASIRFDDPHDRRHYSTVIQSFREIVLSKLLYLSFEKTIFSLDSLDWPIMPKLMALNMSGGAFIRSNDEFNSFISLIGMDLEYLNISGCKSIDDQTLKQFVQQRRSLKQIYCTSCRNMSRTVRQTYSNPISLPKSCIWPIFNTLH